MNYGMWSNIHYGYVGTMAGIDADALQEGAGTNMPGAGRNDSGDYLSVKIGIDLAHRVSPQNLDWKDLDEAIRQASKEYLAKGAFQIQPASQ